MKSGWKCAGCGNTKATAYACQAHTGQSTWTKVWAKNEVWGYSSAVEQLPLKQTVEGSIPSGPTKETTGLEDVMPMGYDTYEWNIVKVKKMVQLIEALNEAFEILKAPAYSKNPLFAEIYEKGVWPWLTKRGGLELIAAVDYAIAIAESLTDETEPSKKFRWMVMQDAMKMYDKLKTAHHTTSCYCNLCGDDGL